MCDGTHTGETMKTINLKNFYAVCDQAGSSPASPSVIADNQTGYTLMLNVGGEQYEVTDDNGERLRFRTIEHVLDLLADAPELVQVARLDFSRWQPVPQYS